MKKIEAKANITAIANKEGRKIAISELPSIYKRDGQKVICEDGAIRSDDPCFYPEGRKPQSNGQANSESKPKATKGRKPAAPKTNVQRLDSIIDNLCTFAAEVEGENHEAEEFKKLVCEAAFIVNLRQTAEAIDKAKAEAEAAEAARLAKIAEQKTAIEALKHTSIKLNEVVSAWIAVNNFMYDEYFDEYMTSEQIEQFKPAEADNSDNSTEAEPTADNEPTTDETTAAEANKVANKRAKKTA